jgi:glycosyltransferase involved in cell wall biosynthesis
MLKIAIDSGPLTSGDSIRGIGTYTRELLRALKMDGVDVLKENLGKYDVVHLTRFHPFFISVPFSKPKNTKFVLSIYDLIPLIYPKHYPPGVKGGIRLLINKYLINKNIDAIITISETSKKDICRFFGVNPKKVYVTYLAPSSIFKKLEIGNWELEIKRRFGLPDRFALYVGDVNYNKNIPNLIKACKIAKVPLVVAGKQAAEIDNANLGHAELYHLKGLDWSPVIRLGFVSDGDLVKIYNLASVYVQPSLYEGFGLPVLEALASGAPIVATKTQCLVEILGDGFDYVDANDPKSLAKGILYPNRNKSPLRKYSWEKTAKETSEIYEQAGN